MGENRQSLDTITKLTPANTHTQTLRLAPVAAHPRSTTNLTSAARTSDNNSNSAVDSVRSAHSAPGLPDRLNASAAATSLLSARASTAPHSFAAPALSSHPLEARQKQWRATQHALKMEGLRRAFGMAEPIRRDMELAAARAGEWRPHVLGGSAGVAGDVLEARDCVLDWDDVFCAEHERAVAELEARAGLLGEIEDRLGIRG